MRKHNKKFCTRWGSERVAPGAAQMSHNIVHSKPFQLAANSLLQSLLRRVRVCA